MSDSQVRLSKVTVEAAKRVATKNNYTLKAFVTMAISEKIAAIRKERNARPK